MGLFGGPNVEKLEAKRDVDGLGKALTNGDPEVRDAAGRALAGIGGPDAVHAIANRMEGQKDVAVLESGYVALRAMGDQAGTIMLADLRSATDENKPLYGALLGRLGKEHGLAPLL